MFFFVRKYATIQILKEVLKMSGFILCKDKDCGHKLVPDFFLDNYMHEADGK